MHSIAHRDFQGTVWDWWATKVYEDEDVTLAQRISSLFACALQHLCYIFYYSWNYTISSTDGKQFTFNSVGGAASFDFTLWYNPIIPFEAKKEVSPPGKPNLNAECAKFGFLDCFISRVFQQMKDSSTSDGALEELVGTDLQTIRGTVLLSIASPIQDLAKIQLISDHNLREVVESAPKSELCSNKEPIIAAIRDCYEL